MKEINIMGLAFVQTCYEHPEQYSVWHGNREVGYIRLRWGKLRADWTGGKWIDREIYHKEDMEPEGHFDSGTERMYHLTEIAKIIKDRIKEEHKNKKGKNP